MSRIKAVHLMCLALTLVDTSCGRNYQNRNQEQPLTSPSGKYVLTVPIETVEDTHRYWRVTITDVNGHLLFKDDSRFVGNLNVYWVWDEHDRVWLRNSDTGFIYYWELDQQSGWQRHQWEQNPNCSFPPTRLFKN